MYRLIRFGAVNLEYSNQVEPIGSGATPTAYQPLPEGGAIDQFGSQQKHPGTVERVKSIRLRGSTEAELETLFLQLLSLRGKRDLLYRRTISGDIHWQYARLAEVIAQRSYEQSKYRFIQDVDLRFVTQEVFWRGDLGGGQWYLDSGLFLDDGLFLDSGQFHTLTTSPTTVTVSVGAVNDAGRAPVRAVRIEVHAGSSNMKSISIMRRGGETIAFTGVVAANTVLVIDTGTMQVLNNGVDAYDDLMLSPTADQAAWFMLEPGDNIIKTSFMGSGTGRKILFSYYEGWN